MAATAHADATADGYLVNVRPMLEMEGPVRRTLPPATFVEVYERKINAEGHVRLRWANPFCVWHVLPLSNSRNLVDTHLYQPIRSWWLLKS